MRNFLLIAVLAIVPFVPGCQCLNWMLYVIAPASRMKTVRPDPTIPSLKDKTLAVLVLTSPDVDLAYGTIRYELSNIISSEFRNQGKSHREIKRVLPIDSRKIVRYQDENPSWDAMPPAELCRSLNADYVLVVSVIEFSTRERGSMHLSRGRLVAEAALYGAETPEKGDPDKPIWRTEDMIRVVYPENDPMGVNDPNRAIQRKTQQVFAEILVRRFYKHKVEKEV